MVAADRINGYNVFYVGKQDLEDAIPSAIWQSIVKKRIPQIVATEKEIDDIKSKIPDNQAIQSSNKLHPRLKALLLAKAEGQEALKRSLLKSSHKKGLN
ncbi:MAG: hypothetical protein HYY49_04260 [Ignavibacteriales bacterium]|nr:hypothetical protein [Ignavibacteriales bacterium]